MNYDKLAELEEQLSTIPKGTVTKKNIKGHDRFYFQWRDENGKTKSIYIKDDEVDSYRELVSKRKSIENQIRKLSLRYFASSPKASYGYYTSVLTGDKLKDLCNQVLLLEKRDCFSKLINFLSAPYKGKICTLYGLRRTGKTTLLLQSIEYLNFKDCAYIKIGSDDNMSDLKKDIEYLVSNGYKYLFIDEITLMEDFIDCSSLLSDIYGSLGIKLVLSGTDSLGFVFANRDQLYDRNIMIHTSYISYAEFSRILNNDSIDSYIEYGGTLCKENMDYDDPDYFDDTVSFRSEQSTRKYIDSAISRNIQHSLKFDNFGENFSHLRYLYEKNELTNVINRIVESMNHEFVINLSHVLYDIDTEKVVSRLKVITEIIEKENTTIEINDDILKQIKSYFFELDLIKEIYIYHENLSPEKHIVFTQPGLRYSIAKALVYSLNKDEYFLTIKATDREYIIKKILEDVKGRMLEDIVILDTISHGNRDKEIFKFKFSDGGEYDMVVFDRIDLSCKIYEIKHSKKSNDNQTRYLLDNDKNDLISYRFGKIKGKYVIYRGEDKISSGIEYLNVEKFLSK